MKYSLDGLYIKKEGDLFIIGLSDKGQDDVGEVVFADLSEQDQVQRGDYLIGVEGDKAVSDLLFPLSGKVAGYNLQLTDQPSLLNSSDVSRNWIVKMTASQLEEWDDLEDTSGLHASSH